MTTTIGFRATVKIDFDCEILTAYDDEYGENWEERPKEDEPYIKKTVYTAKEKDFESEEEESAHIAAFQKTKLYKQTVKELDLMSRKNIQRGFSFVSHVHLQLLWCKKVEEKFAGVEVSCQEEGWIGDTLEFWIDAPNKKTLNSAVRALKKEIKQSSVFLFFLEKGIDMTAEIDA